MTQPPQDNQKDNTNTEHLKTNSNNPLDATNREWQRQAFEAANKTHWLFADTQATNPKALAHPDRWRTDVHHPTTGETGAMVGVLASLMLAAAWDLQSEGGLIGTLPLAIWPLVLAPFVIGIALALLARGWAKRKDDAEQGTPQTVDAPALPHDREETTDTSRPEQNTADP